MEKFAAFMIALVFLLMILLGPVGWAIGFILVVPLQMAASFRDRNKK